MVSDEVLRSKVVKFQTSNAGFLCVMSAAWQCSLFLHISSFLTMKFILYVCVFRHLDLCLFDISEYWCIMHAILVDFSSLLCTALTIDAERIWGLFKCVYRGLSWFFGSFFCLKIRSFKGTVA